MEARTERPSKVKNEYANATAKPELTGSQRHSLKLREPFLEMMRRGKDELEAELFSAVSQIVEDLHYQENPEWFRAEELSPAKQAELNSLIWNSQQVIDDLYMITSGRYWVVNPVVGRFMTEVALDKYHLSSMTDQINALLKRRGRLRETYHRLLDRVAERQQALFLIIGFCLGVGGYKRSIRSYLDKATLDSFEKITYGISGWLGKNQNGKKKDKGNGKHQ